MVLVNQRDPPPYSDLDTEGTECDDIKINDKMFVATSQSAYFDTWGFSVAPGGIPLPVTCARCKSTVARARTRRDLESTVGARACGYIISLAVCQWDRTVVDNGMTRYWDSMTKGFCFH